MTHGGPPRLFQRLDVDRNIADGVTSWSQQRSQRRAGGRTPM